MVRNVGTLCLLLLLTIFQEAAIGQCNNSTQCRVRVLVAIAPGWVGSQSDADLIQKAEEMIAKTNEIMGQSIDPQTLSAGASSFIEYGLTLAGVEVFSADPFNSGSTNCPFTQQIGTRLICRMVNNDLPEFVGWMNHYRADVGIIIRQMNSGVLGQANQSGFSSSPYLVLPAMGGKFLAHELGHVLGCVHGSCGGLSGIPHSACNGAGRGFGGQGFRTLMCQGGTTIDFYSNTWRLFGGQIMGNNNSDCACVVAQNTPSLTCFNDPPINKTQAPGNDVNVQLYADHRVRNSYTIQPAAGVDYTIEPDAKFVIRTGDFVDLKAGFWAKEGGNFRARVKGCYPSNPNNPPDVFRTKAAGETLLESLGSEMPFNLNIQPNPFQDNVLLKLEVLAEESVSLQVLNTQGQIIEQVLDQETLPLGLMERKIDTRQWAKGLYIIRLVGNGQIISKKVIKQ